MLGRHTWWSAPVVTILALLLIRPSASALQQPTIADVLARAASAVAPLADINRVILGEERYRQTLRIRKNSFGTPNGGFKTDLVEMVAAERREWVAELALAATPANEALGYPWMEFRDIVSVGGKRQRDGASRLGILVAGPPDVAGPEAVAVTREATGFVLGRLVRAINLPRLAVVFLHASNQPRFEFKRAGDRTIDGVKTWEVKYRERTTPTIIRMSGEANDAPSSGSFWIDPSTGRVLRSTLRSAESATIRDDLVVSYRYHAESGACLPFELTETIVDEDAGQQVDGTATFANWRVVPRPAR